MPEKNISDIVEGSKQNQLNPKELLQVRIIYLYTTAFLIGALAMIISSIVFHESQLAIAAFSALAFHSINMIAYLFGQKKITLLLCELLFKKLLGK